METFDELSARRTELMAQLGESLYEQARADPALSGGRGALLGQIADVDFQIARLQAVSEPAPEPTPESETASEPEMASEQAGDSVACPQCGAPLAAGVSFCTSCGRRVGEAEPEPEPEQTVAEESASEPGQTAAAPEPEPREEDGVVVTPLVSLDEAPDEEPAAEEPEPEPEVAESEPEPEPEAIEPEPEPAVVEQAASEPLTAGDLGQRFCMHCGASLRPIDRFCMACGTPVDHV